MKFTVWGLKLLIYFQLFEYLLIWAKKLIYQFTALYVITFLLHLLNLLIEIYEFIKKVFVFYFAFCFVDD